MKKSNWIKKIGTLCVLGAMMAFSVAGAAQAKVRIVATTTMLADLAREIGGDQVEVEGLMGPGVDPHLYQASAGDVSRMQNADMVLYNGLHLEGKMDEIFKNLTHLDKVVVNATSMIDESELLNFELDGHVVKDPHIWFDVKFWEKAALTLTEALEKHDSPNKAGYRSRYDAYLARLKETDRYIAAKASEVPESSRVLVTAHDAFQYFARAYGFQVRGLQGVSTATEAAVSDVRDLANFIVEKKIKAIFVESSVPHKTIEAVKEACAAQKWTVAIGGELFSDSLGASGTPEGTYIGMVRYNVDTIVSALK